MFADDRRVWPPRHRKSSPVASTRRPTPGGVPVLARLSRHSRPLYRVTRLQEEEDAMPEAISAPLSREATPRGVRASRHYFARLCAELISTYFDCCAPHAYRVWPSHRDFYRRIKPGQGLIRLDKHGTMVYSAQDFGGDTKNAPRIPFSRAHTTRAHACFKHIVRSPPQRADTRCGRHAAMPCPAQESGLAVSRLMRYIRQLGHAYEHIKRRMMAMSSRLLILLMLYADATTPRAIPLLAISMIVGCRRAPGRSPASDTAWTVGITP